MLKELAKKLQTARKSVGLNQVQVADALRINRNKIIDLEKGETSVDIILLGKLARLYGYSLDYFIDEEIKEDDEVSFAFRATDLTTEDSYIPSWGRRILLNIRNLEDICEEAGI